MSAVVIGYDESEGADQALGVAIEIAQRFEEPLVVVYGAAAPGGLGEEYGAHTAALEEMGRAATGHAVQRAEAAGVRTVVEVAREAPVDALLDAAARYDARMIVVGSFGESPLRGLILGSTTYKVLGRSEVPVLVVRR